MDISLSWIYFCRIGNGFCGWNISETRENGYLSRNLFDRYGEKREDGYYRLGARRSSPGETHVERDPGFIVGRIGCNTHRLRE